MKVELAAAIGEVYVSPGYRKAFSDSFDKDPSAYSEQQSLTDEVIISAFKSSSRPSQRIWEARRLAAVNEINGADMGPFNDYLQGLGGEAEPSDLTVDDLEKGAHQVIRTNSQILGLRNVHVDPIDFFEAALDVIEERKSSSATNVGPENYATAFKDFSDKYKSFPSRHLDQRVIKDLVDRDLDGFIQISEKDPPNFVEMGNVFVAVRTLPRGSVDGRFTNPLVRHSLDQLPNFNDGTLSLAQAAIGNMQLKDDGEAAGTLVDLSMRKGRPFETTRGMRTALKAIANLPPSDAANRTFRTFLDRRNGLEEPLDLEGIDSVNEDLLRVVRHVTDDPDLTLEASEMARTGTVHAIELFNRQRSEGNVTSSQLNQVKATVKRIGANFNQI